jgi:dethiobiotin synthetase
MPGIFITGTDTEIGKTHVACALLKTLKKQNIKAVGMKPVASGAKHINGNWQNEDAVKLMEASSVKLPYELINPYLFKTPASPHIAAELEQQQVELDKIISAYEIIEQQTGFVVVEGVGGWLVPLNKQQTVEDLVKALQLPVVMVVGMRLGCLNHALLTAQHIQQSGLELAGWIANSVDQNFSYLEDNINTLIESINAPLLARLEAGQTDIAKKYEKSISLLAKAK